MPLATSPLLWIPTVSRFKLFSNGSPKFLLFSDQSDNSDSIGSPRSPKDEPFRFSPCKVVARHAREQDKVSNLPCLQMSNLGNSHYPFLPEEAITSSPIKISQSHIKQHLEFSHLACFNVRTSRWVPMCDHQEAISGFMRLGREPESDKHNGEIN
jgi:hypothetical protein